MNELTAFAFASVISLWGSLQLGVVNVNVIYATLFHHIRSALLMAIGGVLPELLYSWIAFEGVQFLQGNEKLFAILKVSAVPVLIGMGIYMYRQKPRTHSEPYSFSGSFFKGLVLALLNPQLITFWFAWILVAYNWIDFGTYVLISPKWAFIIGTAFGAFLMLLIFIWLASRYKRKVIEWMDKLKLNKIIGMLFILIAVVLLIEYLSKL
ncbi:MAG: LysE family transporter [Flavobacteriales bacterium]|nr:LysE family transporter [Flavobacteriales bacterium]